MKWNGDKKTPRLSKLPKPMVGSVMESLVCILFAHTHCDQNNFFVYPAGDCREDSAIRV